MSAPTIPFAPSDIIWFHAVNTTHACDSAVRRMHDACAHGGGTAKDKEKGGSPLCFGLEVDVRFLSGGSSDVPATAPQRLILAHDTLATIAAGAGIAADAVALADVERCPLLAEAEGNGSQITLVGLLQQMSAFVAASHASHPSSLATFILKVDVKDVAALPAVLALFDEGRQHSEGKGAAYSFGAVVLPGCQIWLNMDVVPLAPVSAADAALPPSPPPPDSVAAAALPFFRRAVAAGLGLSLGWQITPTIGEWLMNGDITCTDSSPAAVAERTQAAMRRGNALMLAFIQSVYADADETAENATAGRCVLLTFALNFALYIGNAVGLAALRALCDAAEAAMRPCGSPLVFPTYWRSRSDAITAATAAALAKECREHVGGRTCSVDPE